MVVAHGLKENSLDSKVSQLLLTSEKKIVWASFRLSYELQLTHTTFDMFALYIYLIYIFLDLICLIKIILKIFRQRSCKFGGYPCKHL